MTGKVMLAPNLLRSASSSEQGMLWLPCKLTELKLGMLSKGPTSLTWLFRKLRPLSNGKSSRGVILVTLLSPRSKNRKFAKKLILSRFLISAFAQDSVESCAGLSIPCCCKAKLIQPCKSASDTSAFLTLSLGS